MFERWFSAYCLALRTWWLTSRFLTYQSPLRLLSLFEICEQQAHCRNRARIAVGDTVRLVDVERAYQYRMTLVSSRKGQPMTGMLAVDSYLGSRLLGRAKNDALEVEIFNQRRCFVITEIVHQSATTSSENAVWLSVVPINRGEVMSKKEKKQPQLSLKEKRKLKQEKAAEKGVVKARKSSRK